MERIHKELYIFFKVKAEKNLKKFFPDSEKNITRDKPSIFVVVALELRISCTNPSICRPHGRGMGCLLYVFARKNDRALTGQHKTFDK